MPKFKNLSKSDLERLAKDLAKKKYSHPIIIGLIGPLGSGKTTFVKFFAKQYGIAKITSPTFVISHEYPIKPGKFYHLDFYRLTLSKQLTNLGFSEMAKNHNIIIIEWVDRFPAVKQRCNILISFIHKKEDKRDVTIKYC